MAKRDWDAAPRTYQEVAVVLGDLLGDKALRDIAQTAREVLHVTFAALSFPAPEYSCATTIFVRDSMIMPRDFTPCSATAASPDVFAVPQLAIPRPRPGDAQALRSFAGCAVLDPRHLCVGVFYLMDTKPLRLTAAATARLRAYAELVASRIEIVRRFGGGPGPSPRDIIHQADALASVGRNNEACDLIALAYAAHDIAGIRQWPVDQMATPPSSLSG